MPTLDLQGTKFTFLALPLNSSSNGYWARTELALSNAYVSYRETGENISLEELEEWIVSMCRLLAGAYANEYNLSFEKAGIAIDLYPYTQNGKETTREERRRNDCVMAIRLLMRSPDEKSFLGGVYTLLLHRKEIENFALKLREEFDEVFGKHVHGIGKYLFVGVSPLGYKGCYYWYLDKTEAVTAGDYVWVRMGRHNIEQIVYVDGVRYCNEDTAPYDPARVKQVLRKATEEEIKALLG